jgi:Clr5 domain
MAKCKWRFARIVALFQKKKRDFGEEALDFGASLVRCSPIPLTSRLGERQRHFLDPLAQSYIYAFVSHNDIELSIFPYSPPPVSCTSISTEHLSESYSGLKDSPNMASPKIVLYQPNAPLRSGRIDAKEWDRLRPRVEELYIKDERKLEEVMEIMALQHSFNAR